MCFVVVVINCHDYVLVIIIGNHEYYTGDVDNWLKDLPKIGIKPLVNDRVCLFSKDRSSCQGGLYVAGIEDYETRRLR